MILESVQFLRTNGLAALCEQYKIIAKRHGEFPNLVHLKYSQIESPMGERICQECRGLILDEADDWRVVSCPFFKFFNYGEGHAAQIDWSTARVQEKLDGSLMVLYWHGGAWQVASSGTPDASGPAHSAGMTFAELFWKVWDQLGYRTPVDINSCYMFELMTPHNRIIVPHAKIRLVLHGVRQLDSLNEVGLHHWPWEVVREFPLTSIEQCLAAAEALNPMECEGYVVVDANFNRVKVKGPQYVAMAHLKESMTTRRLLEIVRTGESEEFLSYFPEWREPYGKVRDAFNELCRDLESEYAGTKHIPVQKDFALAIRRSRCSSALFSLRAGKCKSVRDYFAGCTIQALERSINLDDAAALLPVPELVEV